MKQGERFLYQSDTNTLLCLFLTNYISRRKFFKRELTPAYLLFDMNELYCKMVLTSKSFIVLLICQIIKKMNTKNLKVNISGSDY